MWAGDVAQLLRLLVSHAKSPGFGPQHTLTRHGSTGPESQQPVGAEGLEVEQHSQLYNGGQPGLLEALDK